MGKSMATADNISLCIKRAGKYILLEIVTSSCNTAGSILGFRI